jgi:mannose-6-phosphate isomerase-like protein (cupin superfamily)
MEPCNLGELLGRFDAIWSPKTIADLNDHEVKLVKIEGEFVWHSHDETDELFLVIDGDVTIQLRDRDVALSAGDLFVVPRGVEHCPRADAPAAILLIELRGIVNTGDAGGELTAVAERL